MTLRDQLQVIHDEHGKLTPDLVVAAARPKGHPLHDRVFDRPVGQAAEAWYQHRASELIRSVRVVYREASGDETERSVRAFHAVRGSGYEPVERVAEDPFTRQLVLREMEREWRQMLARYEHFEEFLALVAGDLEERKSA